MEYIQITKFGIDMRDNLGGEMLPRAPGLRWRDGRPSWRASKSAVRAGYPVQSANLSALAADPAALVRRCIRLQAEMHQWMGLEAAPPAFDGTIGRLIEIYQVEKMSP
jgi:hypothetical protein